MSDYDVSLNGSYGTTLNTTYFNNGTNDATNVNVGPDFSSSGRGVIFRADAGDTFDLYLSSDLVAQSVIVSRGTNVVLFDSETGARVGNVAFEGNSLASITTFCFTRGARVATPEGLVAIEDLNEGDLVLTRDHGAQPIRWIGSTRLSAETLAQFPEKRPVTIAAGTFGDHAETTVSPGHRILVSGWRAEALFGQAEVLADAESLVNGTTIRRASAGPVDYLHMMFDAHEIVRVDGLWSESFHPGAVATGLESATRDEVLELFPELESGSQIATSRAAIAAADVAVLMG